MVKLKDLKCPKCKKEMVNCFFNNKVGGDYIKCNNKNCIFYSIPRQVDLDD